MRKWWFFGKSELDGGIVYKVAKSLNSSICTHTYREGNFTIDALPISMALILLMVNGGNFT